MHISPHAEKILAAIKEHDEIVLSMHANPDGDAVGSALGMAWFLTQQLHKRVCIYNESPFPKWLSFLPLPCPYYTDLQEIPFSDPLVAGMDASEPKRFGEAFAAYLAGKKSICIDHHLGTSGFGTEYNWVDHTMAATGQMIAQIVYAHSEKAPENCAKALYVALSCDTGNFTFGNTDSACIQCLAKLMDTPLAVAPLREAMDNTWSEQKMRFWGKLMTMVRFEFDGKLAWVGIPKEMYAEFGVAKEDLEGFVEQMRKVRNVRITLLMREEIQDVPFVKVSMRSAGDDDVRSILTEFNGGGHKNAAGAGIFGTLEQVYAMLYPHIEKALQ